MRYASSRYGGFPALYTLARMFGPARPRSLPQPGHLYDVAVVGAGLAGCELAWRLAGRGRDVLLVTQALDTLGNLYGPPPADFPSGSLYARALERRPGQDGWALHRSLKEEIEGTDGIHLLQSCVSGLRAGETVTLATWEGPPLRARAAVLAVGAFLHARLRVGAVEEEAGRLSEVAYDFLADDLLAQGVTLDCREDEVPGEGAQPAYRVRHAVLAESELEGTRLARLPGVYALGRCCPGAWDYARCLVAAAELTEAL